MQMQTKLLMLALCCALVGACSGDDSTGDNENPNQAGHSGRGPDFEDLLDAASGDAGDLLGHDGGGSGGTGGMDPDGGNPMAGTGGSIMPNDGGDVLDAMADTGVMPDDPPIVPEDPGLRGPWPVGVRTALIEIGNGHAPAEIWYPAVRGSEAGKSQEVYDFIKWLPPEAQEDVAAGDKPVPVICDCYRDLPIDAAHGPFPAVIFVHNVGVFRTGSANLMASWASRGFVVVALDHPRLHLQDVLAYTSILGTCTPSGITDDATYKRDINAMLALLRTPEDDFAFLTGAVDATNVAVAGHGDGADYAVRASGEAGVRLIVQLNNSIDVAIKGDVASVAYVTGSRDGTSWGRGSAALGAYAAASVPAVFVSLTNAGHLSATELCNAKSSNGLDGMEIGRKYDLCGLDYDLLGLGWDCSNTLLDQPTANARFGYATVATLEQFLKGKDRSAAWAKISADWGDGRSKSE